MRVDIAGVQVDNLTKSQVLNRIAEFVATNQPHYLVTTYSEFVVFAQSDSEYKSIINNASLSLPDGIGIVWAAKYLSLPNKFVILNFNFFNKLYSLWQLVYTGALLIFYPKYCRSVISETVTGSRFIWNIAELAARNKYSLVLAGGYDRVASLAAKKLEEKYPGLTVKTIDPAPEFDDDLAAKINSSNSDILLIAYQPPKQEKWLAQNLQKLNVKVAIGLGGTFDYLAGKRTQSPKFISHIGLEWFWRLITQPWRIKRIWNAIIIFIITVYKSKVSRI